MGLKIYVNNENIQKAVRRFKKACDREGVTKEFRKHEYYEKPSQARRRKATRARQAALRQEAEKKEQKSFII